MAQTTSPNTNAPGAAGGRHELDSNLVKALSHPLRMRILARLNETVASPNELAREFNESLPLLSYHVRILRDLGCIELVRTTPRRGAIEHHYRAVSRAALDDSDWAQLPKSVREAVSSTVLTQLVDDVRKAVSAGTFEARTDHHLSFTPLVLDEQAWDELNRRLLEVLEWAFEEQAAAAGRLQASAEGGEEVLTRLTMMSYVAPSAEQEDTTSAPAKRKRRSAKS